MEKNEATRNYELKSDAVEELVGADSAEIPEYPEEELSRYRTKSRIHIPPIVKVLFLKAWFYGAVCYFILWGLGMYLGSLVDMLFVLGVVMGLVTDLLLNNVLRFIEKMPGENEVWIMVTKKKTLGLLLNVIYGIVIAICVFQLYNVINQVITSFTGNTQEVPLGVEPVVFGLFCMGFDMLFVACKRLMEKILEDAKRAAGGQRT